MRLGVTIVSNRDWKPKFGVALVMLLNHIAKTTDIRFLPQIQNSLLPKGRRLAIEQAVMTGCTHLLTLDDDMMFAPNVVDLMMRGFGDTRCALVLANYQNKTSPGRPTTQRLKPDGKPEFVESKDKTGLEEVARGGLGLALMDIEKVNSLERPLFAVAWLPDIGAEYGEDLFFCDKVRKAGFKVLVDHDASNRTRHIGEVELEPV